MAEVNQLSILVEKKDNTRIYTDKGYTSKINTKFLKENNLKDGIMCKASKGKALNK